MQVAGIARRSSRVLKSRIFLHPLFAQDASHSACSCFSQFRNFGCFAASKDLILSGRCSLNGGVVSPSYLWQSKLLWASFCSAPASVGDSVKELHDKILESIKVKRSAPPNAWLLSMIEKCKCQDDIKLLFDMLPQLRIFRLSNLRIHDNFNSNLCQEVTKACIRAGALDLGKKALWRHNIYGLSPTIGSVNLLLSYAKEQKDVKLMVVIMSLLKKNDLPLQPATADIVFSICYDAENWELISKYAKRFLQAGVKLRKTTFDIWMEYAVKRGDVKTLWNTVKMRSELYKKHTIKSAFSCAKGFLLERKPESAATIIQDVLQSFPDSKRQDIIAELQQLVSDWPAVVIKHQKQEDQKVFIASLKADISAMVNSFPSMGVVLSVSLEDLNKAEALSC